MNPATLCLVVIASLCAFPGLSSAQDPVPKNAKDHPMISRYESSKIVAG